MAEWTGTAQLVAQLGVGGIFALLLVREAKNLIVASREKRELSSRSNEEGGGDGEGSFLSRMSINRRDFRRLVDKIGLQTDSIEKHTKELVSLKEESVETRKILHQVKGRLDYLDVKNPI